MKLRPFFTFYGGKYRLAPRYPAPVHPVIVEPFAGSAGYAVRYPFKDVVLVERDPVIAGLWHYLINVSSAEIEALPLLRDGETVDDLSVSANARTLIGFWLNKGANGPRKTPSAWMREGLRERQFWGETIRARIARQVQHIRHWKIIAGDYSAAPDIPATWFIDPPYEAAGIHYRYGAKGLNFAELGLWCRGRRGQTIVCENTGATWLPFEHFAIAKSMESVRGKSRSSEAIWLSEAA